MKAKDGDHSDSPILRVPSSPCECKVSRGQYSVFMVLIPLASIGLALIASIYERVHFATWLGVFFGLGWGLMGLVTKRRLRCVGYSGLAALPFLLPLLFLVGWVTPQLYLLIGSIIGLRTLESLFWISLVLSAVVFLVALTLPDGFRQNRTLDARAPLYFFFGVAYLVCFVGSFRVIATIFGPPQ